MQLAVGRHWSGNSTREPHLSFVNPALDQSGAFDPVGELERPPSLPMFYVNCVHTLRERPIACLKNGPWKRPYG